MTKKAMTERQQFWLAHIEAAMRSGEQLQRYARQQGLSIAALYNAKSMFKRAGLLNGTAAKRLPNAFVAVQVAPQGASPIRCRLQHLSGWQLEMERLPEAKWLRDLVSDAAP